MAILSANDPTSFTCVFGISRAGAVWCPINPRNEAAENRELLDLFDCTALLFQKSFAPLVAAIAPDLPKLAILVCLDGPTTRRGSAHLGAVPRRGATSTGPAGRAQPRRRERSRRPGDDRRHRRHDRAAQGRDAHQRQPRDDDGADPDGLPLPRPPRVPRPRAPHPRRRRAVLPRPRARRRDRDHAGARRGRLPGARRAAPGDAHVPAADADLHGPRPPGTGLDGPQLAAVLLVRRRPDVRGPARGGAHRASGR